MYSTQGAATMREPVFLGYILEDAWREPILYISRILNDVTMNLVVKTEFYGSTGGIVRFCDLPELLKEDALSGLRISDEEAQEMANDGRRVVLSQVGFLTWLISAFPSWDTVAIDSDRDFAESLRLEEHEKRGYVFDLRRDRHEFNVRHLINHQIPFHYAWITAESEDARYFCFSWEYTVSHEIVAFSELSGIELCLNTALFACFGIV
ncbi:hypothetical protein K438DRAFT_1991367 [Mycena galopus ATCC 62051]|nr:hypothetical protein K438DRAFT_1991367 [Mycena galopus ATCC 62051]